MSRKTILISLLICCAVVAAAALFASSSPDGLEWVAEKMGFAQRAQEASSAPMSGYAIARLSSPFFSTAISGVLGVLVTIGLVYALSKLLRRR